MSVQSRHSARMVSITRSAYAFAFGARTGVWIAGAPSERTRLRDLAPSPVRPAHSRPCDRLWAVRRRLRFSRTRPRDRRCSRWAWGPSTIAGLALCKLAPSWNPERSALSVTTFASLVTASPKRQRRTNPDCAAMVRRRSTTQAAPAPGEVVRPHEGESETVPGMPPGTVVTRADVQQEIDGFHGLKVPIGLLSMTQACRS